MAILLDITCADGVTRSYHKIEDYKVRHLARTVEVSLATYADKAASQDQIRWNHFYRGFVLTAADLGFSQSDLFEPTREHVYTALMGLSDLVGSTVG